MTTATASTASTPTTPKRARWRTVLAWVLLVVGLVLTPVTVSAIWVRNALLDTDHYVETMAPLARNESIQVALATRITNEIFADQRVQDAIAEQLPDPISFLAAPASEALRQTTYNVTLKITQSPQFAKLWDQANRLAHASVERVLTGSGNIKIETKNGQIVLDLTPIYAKVAERLDQTSLGITNRLPLGALNKTFVIADISTIQGAQTATRILDATADVLPWLVVALLVGSIVAAKDRRRGALRVGVGLLLVTLGFAALLALGRAAYVDAVAQPGQISIDANRAVYDISLRFLRLGNRTVMAIGLVVAIAAALAGASRAALAVRGAFTRVSDRAAAEGEQRGVLGGPASAFVARNLLLLEMSVVVLAFLVLSFAPTPSPMTVLWLTLGTLAIVVALLVVARAGRTTRTA
ncbi:MAG: hypothetical protein ACKOZL_07905 [Actinomycetes bacterium]